MSTKNVQDKTQKSYLTLTLITQACHGILNTTLTPPDPKPKWFDDLNTKLDYAKTVAGNWINNIAPGITAGPPTQVVDYGTTYSALTQQIVDIANAHPDAQGADNKYVKQVHQLVAALEGQVSTIITNAQKISDDLKNWGIDLQKAHDGLSTGAATIQKAETDLQSDIDAMNTAIKNLHNAIDSENTAIAAAAIGVGVGIFLTIVGIALAPETGGASLLVAGTGALLVIGGAITWGIMQAKINKQFKEIATDQNKLDADNRQMVALQGLASASSQATNYTTTCQTALSEFRTSWAFFQGELSGVLGKLQKAEASLSIIVSEAFTNAAAKEWTMVTDYAQNMVGTKVSVVTKEMPMDSASKAA